MLIFILKLKYLINGTRIFGAGRYIEMRAIFPETHKRKKGTDGMTTEKYQREIEEDIFRDLLAIFVHVNLPPNVFAKKTNVGKTRTAIDFKYPRFVRLCPFIFTRSLRKRFGTRSTSDGSVCTCASEHSPGTETLKCRSESNITLVTREQVFALKFP